jgi:hypothetical protein
MSASALLAELDAAGVHLALAGDDLRFRTQPGVSVARYRERITAYKPALLAAVRQRELAAEAALLERGWTWLEAHPDDPRHEAFEARWIERLQQYERSYAEAVSTEPNPSPAWAGVHVGPVEATIPAPDWDGTLPEECGWPNTCGVLGPCPRSLAGGRCQQADR